MPSATAGEVHDIMSESPLLSQVSDREVPRTVLCATATLLRLLVHIRCP
jgi:hypothetical protein